MKLTAKNSTFFILIFGAVIFTESCSKDGSVTSGQSTQQPSITQHNQPPVARARIDKSITFPDAITLDGSGSTDPDYNIKSFLWTKISGPSSFNIVNANEVQTRVTNLVPGVYQFELKVTDNGGLTAKDTVETEIAAITTSNEIILNNFWWDDDYSTQKIHTNAIELPAGYSVNNIKKVYLYDEFWIVLFGGSPVWSEIQKDGTTERIIYYKVDNNNNSVIAYWYYYNTQPEYIELAFLPLKMKIEFN